MQLLLVVNDLWDLASTIGTPSTDATKTLDSRCCEGPYYPSYIGEEDSHENVGGSKEVILE